MRQKPKKKKQACDLLEEKIATMNQWKGEFEVGILFFCWIFSPQVFYGFILFFLLERSPRSHRAGSSPKPVSWWLQSPHEITWEGSTRSISDWWWALSVFLTFGTRFYWRNKENKGFGFWVLFTSFCCYGDRAQSFYDMVRPSRMLEDLTASGEKKRRAPSWIFAYEFLARTIYTSSIRWKLGSWSLFCCKKRELG